MFPIPVLTARQAAEWDERARSTHSVPSRVLMESAGRAAALAIARTFGERLGAGVLVAAGSGNNGGDGWVTARALHAVGVAVNAVEVGRNRSADCEANRTLALAEGVRIVEEGEVWPAAGVVVDALLGTGASGPPRGAVAQLASRIAQVRSPVAAIDGPTGLNLSTGEAHGPVRAQLTVTFGGVRRGHLAARDWCGTLMVADIGFPPPDPAWPVLITDRWVRDHLPRFAPGMHKGDRGHVLVIGGDTGMAGAAIHAARAAFQCGAGIVKLAVPGDSLAAAQANLPDALTVATRLGPGVEPELADAMNWADSIVLGPGLGRAPERERFARAVLETAAVPLVIDADALHVLAGNLDVGKAMRVLTPHPGEFAVAFPGQAHLLNDDRYAAAASAHEASGGNRVHTLLLKGVPTVIACRSGLRVVAAGNPSLATGGSGDLLAGAVAAFLAAGLVPEDAAALGAQALGRAADLAVLDHTVRATRPEHVAAEFPNLWRRWSEPEVPMPPVMATLDSPQLE